MTHTSPRNNDKGFSLPEVLVALTLVTVALTGFAVLLTAIAGSYRITSENLQAEALLADEAAFVQALQYDDIIEYSTTPEPCNIASPGAPQVMTVPSIATTSEPVMREGVQYTVSRAVSWYSDPAADPVACNLDTLTPRDDIKVVSLTVEWSSPDGTSNSRTAYVYASPYSGQGRDLEVLP